MEKNQKIWKIIKEIKAGNMTIADVKASLNETEWNILNDVFGIAVTTYNDPNYYWTNGIILDPVNK